MCALDGDCVLAVENFSGEVAEVSVDVAEVADGVVFTHYICKSWGHAVDVEGISEDMDHDLVGESREGGRWG